MLQRPPFSRDTKSPKRSGCSRKQYEVIQDLRYL